MPKINAKLVLFIVAPELCVNFVFSCIRSYSSSRYLPSEIYIWMLPAGSVRLMEVAGMIPGRSTIAVTVNTRMHCSVLMQRLYDDTLSDQQRDKIRALTDEYFV